MNITSLLKSKTIIKSLWIDVSKDSLSLCFLSEDKKTDCTVANSKKWLEMLISKLQKLCDCNLFIAGTPIVIESTSYYHLLTCVKLSDAWFCVKEINPIITKQFTAGTIRWTKTDTTDAYILAQIWIVKQNFLKTFSRSKVTILSKKKMSLIACLEKQIQSMNSSLTTYKKTCAEIELNAWWTIDLIEDQIKLLIKSKKKLEKELYEDLCTKEESQDALSKISSIPWVSTTIASIVYCSMNNYEFVSKKSLYSFFWFDTKIKQSWKSFVWVRISKRWNPFTRKKLFQAAFCWIQHCEEFSKIYHKAKEKWKHHFEAVIIVIKKIVHIIYALLKNWTTYNQNH